MEHEQVSSGSICDKLPPLSSKYPWFLVQNLEEEDHNGTEFFSTLHDPLIKYQYQIPEFHGRRMQGCFHGWLILSNHPHNIMWFLWNPVTSKIIRLPPLILKEGDGESIDECCLTAPPDDPTSVLLLTRCDASTFVFCWLNRKRKRMKWIEMSFAKQLKRITANGELLHNLTCCNGKIYALNCDGFICHMVIQVEIVVKDREVMIQLLMFGASPTSDSKRSWDWLPFLKGYGTELFCIKVGFHKETEKIDDVCLFRLDTTSIKWEELECLKKWDLTGMKVEEADLQDLAITEVMWKEINDLKEAIFYVDLACDCSIFYNPAVASELGGYIHIRDKMGEILYMHHVKDRTIIASSMPSRVVSTTHVSMWEGRLEEDHVEAKFTATFQQEKDERVVTSVAVEEVKHNGSHLHNIPFDVLEMIMEHCVGVEYLNFRATCKLCHLAAPLIRWSSESSLRRLQNYSLNSAWLMVVDKHRGIVSFTDPLLGDNYFMKKSQLSIFDDIIHCSRYGWLLFESSEFICPVFFNPFTSDLRKLPDLNGDIKSLCFSAPPTSSDCIVAAFTTYPAPSALMIYFVSRKRSWRLLDRDANKKSIYTSTFIGRDLYALCKEGEVIVFKYLGKRKYSPKIVLAKAPISCCSSMAQYFMMNCDEHLLLVIVGEFGEVEVFKRNDSIDKWEKIDGVGKHTIYICGTTSLCIDAKTPEMQNKIYFSQLVFYSFETCTYHTFDGKIIKENFGGVLGTKRHFNSHAWIEPSWC